MGRRHPVRRTIDELLTEARRRIVRFEPPEALIAAKAGGLIVDLRTDHARERDGIVPGSLHIPRSVFEWRIDPTSPWRNPAIAAADRLILLCAHGFSSSLAAAMAVDLGFVATGDIIGGFEAWRASGLPIARPRRPTEDDPLPGMGPID
jgi:rhodanese-related sulfurtransferase